MTTKNLLVELFVEELPPKALNKLGEAFAGGIFDGLQRNHLLSEASVMTSYASPRRLAVHITGVRETSVPTVLREKLMPVSVGLAPDGKPTPALIKKLVATLGYPPDAAFDAIIAERVRRQSDGKHEVLVHESIPTGTALRIGLEGAIESALTKLPIPKVMSYQLADGWATVNFVRPVHGLVVLHGTDVVPMTVLGIDSGRETHGHRFEASIDPIEL
ncbi:MAG: glycine--tRNA ligase subunit beta, partial [Burkholderiales bacterium]|nr:glycine--tRNA ligase subunit beta [Burkholderiales bacterium]